MTWKFGFSQESQKFLKTNKITEDEIIEIIRKTVRKFQGENINIDIRKLKGEWLGFYRIRKGNLRIITEFNFDKCSVLIEKIDWRGEAYK